MRVILAEKPAMGKDIADALGVSQRKKGYITLQSGDVVTWAIGHIIQQKQPDSYIEYKEWTLENLPFVPDPIQMEADPNKDDQLKIIRDLLSQATGCIIATDPGREGEHIARTILEFVGFKGKLERLWIDDLTPETIKLGFSNLKDGALYDNLAAAAKVRSAADFWMGITATRFFSVLARNVTQEKTTLSAGRVITPTLRIVYDRENAIQNFVSEPFYVLMSEFKTQLGTYRGQWFSQSSEGTVYRFEHKEQADRIRKKVDGQQGSVIHYKENRVKRYAPQLFDGTALRTAARKELGFGIKKTTDLLQKVYDKKYCSYPRTSSRHLSDNAADQLENHLNKLRLTSKYQSLFPHSIESIKDKKRFVDNSKVSEHHAIIPTSRNPEDYKQDPENQLSTDEEKLYELILRHTLAAFHPEGVDQETEVITEVNGETFSSKSVFVISQGWRDMYKLQEDPEDTEKVNEQQISKQNIPKLEQGQSTKVDKLEINTGKTSKPKRMTDTDLENAMKYAGRMVDEEAVEDDILQQLKEKGIGTPATRVQTIEKLIKDEYMDSQKNLIYLTDKGRNFMDMVYHHPIASIELTGEFEKKLEEVASGIRSASVLLEEFKQFSHDILELKDDLQKQIESKLQGKPLFENRVEVGKCPNCGKAVIENGKTYSCCGKKEGCTFMIWKSFRKTELKLKQIRDLLEGKEIFLRQLPGAEGKLPYDLYVKLKDGNLDTRFPTVEDSSLGECPLCGKSVTEKDSFYGCSGWREGCKFSISKTFRKKELNTKTIKSVLLGKEVLVKDLPKADGVSFYNMYIYISVGKLESRYSTPEDSSLGSCPLCKKPVVENNKSYGCSGWKEGCKFSLPKEFLTVSVTASQLKKLLKSGKTDKLKEFKGGKGSFDTALGYDATSNRYSFVK